MKDQPTNLGTTAPSATNAANLPAAVDRTTFQAELDKLRIREKAHTREGDAIAAARRRLPMVDVDANLTLIGPDGPLTLLEAFEGRRQLIAYYFMGTPANPRPSSAKAARGSPPRSRSCPTFIPATSPTRSSVRPLRRKHPLPRLRGMGHTVVLSTALP
jgi:hypothetical protein